MMGCIYESNSFNEDVGKCTLWEENVESRGCDECGICVVSEDPQPSDSCEDYESDWTCIECGVDLNVEDCECEDEDDNLLP